MFLNEFSNRLCKSREPRRSTLLGDDVNATFDHSHRHRRQQGFQVVDAAKRGIVAADDREYWHADPCEIGLSYRERYAASDEGRKRLRITRTENLSRTVAQFDVRQRRERSSERRAHRRVSQKIRSLALCCVYFLLCASLA